MLSNSASKERDLQVVEFIKQFPCYSDTIAKVFYPSQRMANYKLKELHENKCVKRDRKYTHEKYFYYIGKKRTRKEHYDLIARTYYWIKQNDYEVTNVKVQNRQDSIEPDMILEIKQNNQTGILAVEIERTKNIKRTISKYEESQFKSILLVSNLETGGIDNHYIKIYNLNFKELG